MFAMAGVSGARCASLRPLRMDWILPIGVLIFCERMSFLRIGRLVQVNAAALGGPRGDFSSSGPPHPLAVALGQPGASL